MNNSNENSIISINVDVVFQDYEVSFTEDSSIYNLLTDDFRPEPYDFNAFIWNVDNYQ